MTNKIKFGLIIITVALLIGFISVKKASKTNVTLVGIIHGSKNMLRLLDICQSDNAEDVEILCQAESLLDDEESQSLCRMHADFAHTNFINKCQRYYRFVERVKLSQSKVAEYLKNVKHDAFIYESQSYKNILEKNSPYLIDLHKHHQISYLFAEDQMLDFIQTHPGFENDIIACKDYKTEKKCDVMDLFMKLHSEVTQKMLLKSSKKNVVVIMEQDHMNYVSCKNFDENRFNCLEVSL